MVKRPAKKKASQRPAKKTSTGTKERTRQTSSHLPVSVGPDDEDDDPWISISEVARQIKKPRSTVHRWCIEGLMKAARRRPHGHICVRYSEAMKFTEVSALNVKLSLPATVPKRVDENEPVRSADISTENGSTHKR